MIEVLLSLDPRDGNDPLEASVLLPQVPREGDEIEAWINQDDPTRPAWISGPAFLEVEKVIWSAYWPERIVIAVRADTYDRAEVERIFTALANKEKP